MVIAGYHSKPYSEMSCVMLIKSKINYSIESTKVGHCDNIIVPEVAQYIRSVTDPYKRSYVLEYNIPRNFPSGFTIAQMDLTLLDINI